MTVTERRKTSEYGEPHAPRGMRPCRMKALTSPSSANIAHSAVTAKPRGKYPAHDGRIPPQFLK